MSDLFQDAVKMEDETAVAVVPEEKNSLLMEAVKKGLDAESIKMLVELANKQEDRRRKEEFDSHFNMLRSELRPIVKNKVNKAFNSKYAPLEDLQYVCDETIFRHGFAYSWREEPAENGKLVIMDITGYGHTKSNSFFAPTISGNNAQNALQTQGILSTFGQRYTFKAGFGIVIAGEDSDGMISDDAGSLTIDLREYINSGKLTPEAVKVIEGELAKESPDIDKLKVYWKKAKAKVEK